MTTVSVQSRKSFNRPARIVGPTGTRTGIAGGVLRACAMTLLVVAEDDADAEHVRQTLGELMHDHPSRAIVLKATEGAELNARVFAECWMPLGGISRSARKASR